jgi:hypothetical protein
VSAQRHLGSAGRRGRHACPIHTIQHSPACACRVASTMHVESHEGARSQRAFLAPSPVAMSSAEKEKFCMVELKKRCGGEGRRKQYSSRYAA